MDNKILKLKKRLNTLTKTAGCLMSIATITAISGFFGFPTISIICAGALPVIGVAFAIPIIATESKIKKLENATPIKVVSFTDYGTNLKSVENQPEIEQQDEKNIRPSKISESLISTPEDECGLEK